MLAKKLLFPNPGEAARIGARGDMTMLGDRTRIRIATGTVAVALAILGWGSVVARDAAAAAEAPSSTGLRADLLYHNYCSVCHGDRGDGRSRASNSLVPPPYDFTSARARVEMSRERIIAMVTHGKPGTAMVGWRTQLNGREIAALADYVMAAFVRPNGPPKAAAPSIPGVSGTRAHGGRASDRAPAPVIADMSLGFPGPLVGDAAKGKTFYDANCATCHGVTGDGKGPRAYFINPKPRGFLTDASRATYNRPALFAAVSAGRNGSEMPAWDKVLTPQQIADVAEYVFQAFIRGPGESIGRADAR
ncbi:MAG: c-type cytochrome [Burkholderiales bacterium]|nr:MAG: c-type cytochrome [Burkholderiales bacterium]